jgi:hypothetical protein
MKVLIGMTEVAGYYSSLREGLRGIGVEADFLCVTNPFQYAVEPFPRHGWLLGLIEGARRRSVTAGSRGSFRRIRSATWKVGARLLLALLFAALVPRYDVFVFGFASQILPLHLDHLILRLLGKRVVCVFNGSDHRPPYLNGISAGMEGVFDAAQCAAETGAMKRMIWRIERFSDVIICHHLSAHLHEKRFIPYLLLGFARSIEVRETTGIPSEDGGSVRILHAPSRPLVKGTERIRKAVQRLEDEGLAIDYREISRRPHAEVLEEIARCDFVVDELFSDARMAGLATEAAFYGKPSVVCGYASDELMSIPGAYLPSDFPPVCFGPPESVEQLIRRLVVDPEYRLGLGRRARDFVRSRWTPREVAVRFLRILRGDIPRSWWFEPGDVRYLHGFGFDEVRLKEVLRALMALGGTKKLRLTDKPELERRIREFACA